MNIGRAGQLIFINTIVLAGLLGIVNLASGILLREVLLAEPPLAGGLDNPAYQGQREEMKRFFAEYQQLSSTYKDYVGWDRRPFDGEAITINGDGDRTYTPRPAKSADAPIARFFGGSTMWGTGAVNEDTIPAQFEALRPHWRVYNHGETAYVSRQGLAWLVNLYSEGKHSDLVVFYDGVNDVGALCRREVELPGTIQQKQIQREMQHSSGLRKAWGAAYALLFEYTVRVVGQLRDTDGLYDCSSNQEKAHRVAAHLVETWKVAHDLVVARGGRFVGVLQPVAYLGRARTGHVRADLSARGALGEQFRTVYPLIRQKMAGYDYLYDLSHAFDGDQIIFTDWAHSNRRGNAIIAELIGRVENGHETAKLLPSTAKTARALQ